MYKTFRHERGQIIVRPVDNASIPEDSANRDYQEYLVWLAEGNTPEIISE